MTCLRSQFVKRKIDGLRIFEHSGPSFHIRCFPRQPKAPTLPSLPKLFKGALVFYSTSSSICVLCTCVARTSTGTLRTFSAPAEEEGRLCLWGFLGSLFGLSSHLNDLTPLWQCIFLPRPASGTLQPTPSGPGLLLSVKVLSCLMLSALCFFQGKILMD